MEDDKKEVQRDLVALAIGFITFILLILTVSLSSCGTCRQVNAEQVSTINNESHESSDRQRSADIVRDSVETTRYIYVNGDTVRIYVDRWHTSTKLLTDTVELMSTDTVFVSQAKTKTVVVEKKRSLWRKICDGIGLLSILAISIVIIKNVRKHL